MVRGAACQAVRQFSKHSVVILPDRVASHQPSHLDPMHRGAAPHPFPLPTPGPGVPSCQSLTPFFDCSFPPSATLTDSQLPGPSLHRPPPFKVNMLCKFHFSKAHFLRFQGASLQRRISRLLKKSQPISKTSRKGGGRISHLDKQLHFPVSIASGGKNKHKWGSVCAV